GAAGGGVDLAAVAVAEGVVVPADHLALAVGVGRAAVAGDDRVLEDARAEVDLHATTAASRRGVVGDRQVAQDELSAPAARREPAAAHSSGVAAEGAVGRGEHRAVVA